MNAARRLASIVATLVLTLARASNGAGPPNPTGSDGNFNTAGGQGALSAVSTGQNNTGFGFGALTFLGTGSQNTAVGKFALGQNLVGSNNTAVGFVALFQNAASDNTAVGANALAGPPCDVFLCFTGGAANTAIGARALGANDGGSYNTADGVETLQNNSSGSSNTALGFQALQSNTTGALNTASGFAALQGNDSGASNAAVGVYALQSNLTGSNNSAFGYGAHSANTSGNGNTALGSNALANNSDGNGNIAVGSGAGVKLASGNKNVYLGHKGKVAESNTMRLGSDQTRTFIAGIGSTPVSGSTVLVNAQGQLGILASSARYKRDIETMGERSGGLLQLRPITFRYKHDSSGERQYGLVAEEVAKVYPELVVRSGTGEVQSVKYEELIPMLLNQAQHQEREVSELRTQNAALAARLARLEEVFAQAATLASR